MIGERCEQHPHRHYYNPNVVLIVHFEIKIKDLISAGKDYPWPRPGACPCCGGKLWGHGYTPRYFEGAAQRLWLKRYRCIECHAVHTLRPKTHWRRFQATLAAIIQSLRSKITDDRWTQDFSRQRQQYWFKGFKIQLARGNPAAVKPIFKHLRSLLVHNVIAATHSLKWSRMILRGPLACVPVM